MKSPRRIELSDQMIAEHNLSTDPPPSDSLFWTMWSSCSHLAEEALQTPFIQGIKAGALDPVRYGAFNVSDAYYCFHGAKDYATAVKRADYPTLKAFLSIKYNGYQKYNATFPEVWRIKDRHVALRVSMVLARGTTQSPGIAESLCSVGDGRSQLQRSLRHREFPQHLSTGKPRHRRRAKGYPDLNSSDDLRVEEFRCSSELG